MLFFLAWAGVQAMAPVQVAPVQEIDAQDTIVVTSEWFGADDIAAKQSADGIIDVGPDALAVQPSTNIADALGRLPGVAVETERGASQFVQLRGLRPELNSVTLDGVIIGAAEGLGGGRQAPLDLYSTRLVTQLELVKTPTPDMEGQGIGAVLNIVTTGSKDDAGDGWAGSAAILGGGGDNVEGAVEAAGDILYADPNGHWTLRGALAVEVEETDTSVFLQRSWGFAQPGFPELLRYEREEDEAERYAGSLAVTLFPADGHSIDLSFLRSYADDTQDFLRYEEGVRLFSPIDATSGTVSFRPGSRVRATQIDRDIQVARALGTHALSDEQTLSWRLALNETTLQRTQQEWDIVPGDEFLATLPYRITDDPFVLVDQPDAPDYSAAGISVASAGWEDASITEDGLTAGLDYTHMLFSGFDLKVGAQWRRAVSLRRKA